MANEELNLKTFLYLYFSEISKEQDDEVSEEPAGLTQLVGKTLF